MKNNLKVLSKLNNFSNYSSAEYSADKPYCCKTTDIP